MVVKHPVRVRMRATLADVAKDVGLNPSTVSRALDPTRASMVNAKTRERIVEAAERLGYRPHLQARSLMTGRTQTIVVIAADLGNTWVTPILHGVASRVAVDGLVPIIAETNDDSTVLAELIDHMLSRRVDGIIVLAARRQDSKIIEATARLVPVVVAARPLLDISVPVVTHDDRRGGAIVARHFAEQGHKLVAQLLGPTDVMNFPLRDQGFSAVARARGMKQVRIRDEAEVPTFEEGARLMTTLLESASPVPTAVLAHNDDMAVGAMWAVRQHGLRVPHDVAVAGYNDMPLTGFLDPSLTTVHYPSWEVGHEAAEAMLRLLAGDDEVGSVSLDPVLVVRDSTRQSSAG